MRIDKYIWCIRIFKTRSLASKACASEKVMLNGEFVKPSKEVKSGDEVRVKDIPIWRSYEVIDFPKSRVGAKLVADYARETTAEADLDELEKVRLMNKQNRESGIYGRPTKRNRRDLDRFKSS